MSIGSAHTNIDLRSSETKLKEETHRLAALNDALSRSNALTSGMVSTLESFDRKLQSLDELVTPVYEATNELRLLLDNVDGSLGRVDAILPYYDICNDLTSIISAGPGGHLAEYLAELVRLQNAVKYFKTVAAVGERERVIQLYELGRRMLIDEADKLITRYANPLSVEELMALRELTDKKSNDIHSMPVSDMDSLRQIIEWLSSHGFRQGLIDSYANKRGTMIRRSLQLLAKYLESKSIRRVSSITQAASMSAATNDPAIAEPAAHLRRKSSESGGLFRRISRHTAPFKSSGTSLSSLAVPVIAEDNVVLESSDAHEAKNYEVLLTVFMSLLRRERLSLNKIFQQDVQSVVFTELIGLPLAYMQDEAQGLCESTEKLPRKLNTGKLAVYGLFSVLKWFLKSRPMFLDFYKDIDAARRLQFTNLPLTFEKSAVNCFRKVLEEVHTDTSTMSSNANVHSITSQVLAFMEDLLNHEETVTAIASLYVQTKQRAGSGGASGAEKGLHDLGSYFVELVLALHENLSKKIEAYAAPEAETMRAIFLLNNLNYLLKRLENSPLLAIIHRCQPGLFSKYEGHFQTAVKDFTKCYSRLLTEIQQMHEYEKSNHLPNAKLRDRDREKLKESFSAVNTAIDGLREQCSRCLVNDVHLRERLRKESKECIVKPFRDFFDKFAQKEFTKNREKYIRYEPQDVEKMIEQFFDDHS